MNFKVILTVSCFSQDVYRLKKSSFPTKDSQKSFKMSTVFKYYYDDCERNKKENSKILSTGNIILYFNVQAVGRDLWVHSTSINFLVII